MTTAAPTIASIVEQIYAAFGRGDIQYILSQLSPDVVWGEPDDYGERSGIPVLQSRRGPDEVAAFFAEIEAWTFHTFDVQQLLSGGRSVAAVVYVDTGIPGGGRMAAREIHLWEFGPDNKVASFSEFYDTARMIAACEGVDTTKD
ncbi:nuclear transport factor 2 family protein [Aldersonia kunmingensis]|uniref:nuclear transport factor 2 family protein n=1 Tax=Aldersonia kunmingensis TaxID=408066 RepID=UPI00082E4CAD|nr:nuclear transport factor 2 family protein [Aldersonia kunmingensis]